eukprot:comp23215_c1_seq1/m.37802 comp23215_c1_seq1/g.37802  ORF comp23215_c1_seq1/g.37802 comp23215_c1_seq1/m.37802 type:complete len:156 (-) comp23215_c1_seq1:229-696(-)
MTKSEKRSVPIVNGNMSYTEGSGAGLGQDERSMTDKMKEAMHMHKDQPKDTSSRAGGMGLGGHVMMGGSGQGGVLHRMGDAMRQAGERMGMHGSTGQGDVPTGEYGADTGADTAGAYRSIDEHTQEGPTMGDRMSDMAHKMGEKLGMGHGDSKNY